MKMPTRKQKTAIAVNASNDPVQNLEKVLEKLDTVYQPLDNESYFFGKEIDRWNKRVQRAKTLFHRAETPEAREAMSIFMEQAQSYKDYYTAKLDQIDNRVKELRTKREELQTVIRRLNTFEANRKIASRLEEMTRESNFENTGIAKVSLPIDREVSNLIYTTEALMDLRSTTAIDRKENV